MSRKRKKDDKILDAHARGYAQGKADAEKEADGKLNALGLRLASQNARCREAYDNGHQFAAANAAADVASLNEELEGLRTRIAQLTAQRDLIVDRATEIREGLELRLEKANKKNARQYEMLVEQERTIARLTSKLVKLETLQPIRYVLGVDLARVDATLLGGDSCAASCDEPETETEAEKPEPTDELRKAICYVNELRRIVRPRPDSQIHRSLNAIENAIKVKIGERELGEVPR